MKIPHAVIDPEGLRHEVGNVSVLQSWQRNGQKAYPHCMQTGMHACGSVIPTEAQRSGLERRQNSVIGSRKTVMTVRDEGENGAKVRTPHALAVGVCQFSFEQKKMHLPGFKGAIKIRDESTVPVKAGQIIITSEIDRCYE